MDNKGSPLYKKAIILEYLTIFWNILEGGSSILVGLSTGSISLFAYGLESSVEIFAASVVLWQLRGEGKQRVKTALKLIGFAYLVVSAYIFYDASQSFLAGHHPEKSSVGIVLMVFTATAMGILGIIKKRVGKKMENQTVLADAKFTLIDAALSSTVLIGLILNTVFGWWWADQAMALFLSGVAFREGIKEIF